MNRDKDKSKAQYKKFLAERQRWLKDLNILETESNNADWGMQLSQDADEDGNEPMVDCKLANCVQRERELGAIATISKELCNVLIQEAILPVTLTQTIKLMQVDGAALALLDPNDGEVVIKLGLRDGVATSSLPLQPGSVSEHVIISGKPYVNNDVKSNPDPRFSHPDLASSVKAVACVPLNANEQKIGALWVGGQSTFTKHDIRLLLTIGNISANAIHRAILHDQLLRYTDKLEMLVAERTSELTRANERLKKLNKLKSRFISDVTHELRTPIANLTLYVELLSSGIPDRREKYMVMLLKQTQRLEQLVENILDISHLDTESTWRERQGQFDLNEVVGQVISDYLVRAEAAGLSLVFEPDDTLPSIKGERIRLAQVTTNLVINALKYTPSGGVCVTTFLSHEGDQLCLQVKDTGTGIAPEDLPHLFERFYRGQGVRQYNIPGTGLGLSIVAEIVRRYGGRVEVQSEVGVGSTFQVWLPAK